MPVEKRLGPDYRINDQGKMVHIPGPYGIGSDHWPGLSKLNEEAGEVVQVIGKIMGTGGDTTHWDGAGDLKTRLEEEMADVMAAIQFVSMQNHLDQPAMKERMRLKLELFLKWHVEQKL